MLALRLSALCGGGRGGRGGRGGALLRRAAAAAAPAAPAARHASPARSSRLSSSSAAASSAAAAADAAADAAAAASGGAPDAGAVQRLADAAASDVRAGAAALTGAFGGDDAAATRWVTTFYAHRRSELAAPALALLAEDSRQVSLPTLAAKNSAFFGALLAGLPPDAGAMLAARLTVVPRLPLELLLSIVHSAAGASPAARAAFDRLGASVRRAGRPELTAAAAHVAATDGRPPSAWPSPVDAAAPGGAWAAAAAREAGDAWRGGSGGGGRAPLPWERLPALAAARADGGVSRHDYLLLAGTTFLECNWAEFYATGGAAPLERVLDTAALWGEFDDAAADAAGGDRVSLLADVSAPLPDALTAAGRAPGAPPAAAAAAARAAVARAAAWSVLTFARRHGRVGEALARACVPLGPHVTEPAARDAALADAAARAAAGAPGGAPPLAPAAAAARLRVLPGLLHLLASASREQP